MSVELVRQFFLSVPREMAEAAQIDGAGPMQFFARILVPMSRTPIAAMFVIQFILVMATTLLAMLPPVAVVILMQRSFIAGMTETEK